MLNFFILILFMSMLLYLLLGGADFGSGILELFHSNYRTVEQKKIISKAMGPVWEANHVWLILAIVILFSVFPIAYAEISKHLHIPILILLLGIILRGCSFTFRTYDAFTEEKSQKYYSFIFTISSVISSFFIGVIGASFTVGMFVLSHAQGYRNVYISPWINGFSFLSGLFVCLVFTMLASAYLIGETPDKKFKQFFAKRFLISLAGVMITALALVGVGDVFYKLNLMESFVHKPVCFFLVTLSFLLSPLSVWAALKHYAQSLRILVGIQFTLLYSAAFFLNYPILYKPLTFVQSAAPSAPLTALTISFVVGLLLILPSLSYLIYLFKLRK